MYSRFIQKLPLNDIWRNNHFIIRRLTIKSFREKQVQNLDVQMKLYRNLYETLTNLYFLSSGVWNFDRAFQEGADHRKMRFWYVVHHYRQYHWSSWNAEKTEGSNQRGHSIYLTDRLGVLVSMSNTENAVNNNEILYSTCYTIKHVFVILGRSSVNVSYCKYLFVIELVILSK